MIKISENAAKRIQQLKTEENHNDGVAIRVKVQRGGCSGFSYKLDFDQKIDSEKDKTFQEHGISVVIDSQSLLYLVGMTLDFEGGLNGAGFVFSNPNATKTCGCGTSFAV